MINLGLQRISRLLGPLFATHPTALPWKAIHIAGTNGKGSVAALVSTFLAHSGYTVGRFTSPHVVDRWDCITVDQRVVERERFLAVEKRVLGRSVELDVGASEFEILTATAFELFAEAGVDVAVVECGLGGRLDATNVLRTQDVLVSVLTKVGLDHTDFLGETIEAIAGEKAGIFKDGVPVVVDRSNEAVVLEVVRRKVAELGCVLAEQTGASSQNENGLGLAKHQAQNLETALTAFSVAEGRLSPSTPPRVEQVKLALPALVRAAISSLPGRLQWLTRPPPWIPSSHDDKHPASLPDTDDVPILLDGAHNPQSAQALASYIDETLRPHITSSSSAAAAVPTPMTWVLAVKNDKDVRTLLSLLLRRGDNVVTCSFGPVEGMPWVKSMDATELARVVREVTTDGTVEAADAGAVQAAVERAVEIARESRGLVCIAGSLYLVGDVLRGIRDRENR